MTSFVQECFLRLAKSHSLRRNRGFCPAPSRTNPQPLRPPDIQRFIIFTSLPRYGARRFDAVPMTAHKPVISDLAAVLVGHYHTATVQSKRPPHGPCYQSSVPEACFERDLPPGAEGAAGHPLSATVLDPATSSRNMPCL